MVTIFNIFFIIEFVIQNTNHRNQYITIWSLYSDIIFSHASGMYLEMTYNNSQLTAIVIIKCFIVFILSCGEFIINCLYFSRTYYWLINKFFAFLSETCQKYSISVCSNCLWVHRMCLVFLDLSRCVLRF